VITPTDDNIHGSDVLPALRDLLNQHREVRSLGPEELADHLWMLHYLPYRPHAFAVEAALEALLVDGEVLP
jgi:hypothetical protein